MSKIVVDTCVFIRLEGEYKNTHNCILNCSDTICISKEILNEYAGRAKSSPIFHLRPFLMSLQEKKKITHVKTSFVKSKVKRLENSRSFNYPEKARDVKFVKLSIATKSRYLVSTDPHFLDLPANRYNGAQTEHIDPTTYNQLRTS